MRRFLNILTLFASFAPQLAYPSASFLLETEARIAGELKPLLLSRDPPIVAIPRFKLLSHESARRYAESQLRAAEIQESLRRIDQKIAHLRSQESEKRLKTALVAGGVAGTMASGYLSNRQILGRKNAARVAFTMDRMEDISRSSLAEGERGQLLAELLGVEEKNKGFWTDAIENHRSFEQWAENSVVKSQRGHLVLTVFTNLPPMPIFLTPSIKRGFIQLTLLDLIADEILSPSQFKWELVRLWNGDELVSLDHIVKFGKDHITFVNSKVAGEFRSRADVHRFLRAAKAKDSLFISYFESLERALDSIFPGASAFNATDTQKVDAKSNCSFLDRNSESPTGKRVISKVLRNLEKVEEKYPLYLVQDWTKGGPFIKTVRKIKPPAPEINRPWAYEYSEGVSYRQMTGGTSIGEISKAGATGTTIFALVAGTLFAALYPDGANPMLLSEAPRPFNAWTVNGDLSRAYIAFALQEIVSEVDHLRESDPHACMKGPPCEIPLPILEDLPPIAEKAHLEFKGEPMIKVEADLKP